MNSIRPSNAGCSTNIVIVAAIEKQDSNSCIATYYGRPFDSPYDLSRYDKAMYAEKYLGIPCMTYPNISPVCGVPQYGRNERYGSYEPYGNNGPYKSNCPLRPPVCPYCGHMPCDC